MAPRRASSGSRAATWWASRSSARGSRARTGSGAQGQGSRVGRRLGAAPGFGRDRSDEGVEIGVQGGRKEIVRVLEHPNGISLHHYGGTHPRLKIDQGLPQARAQGLPSETRLDRRQVEGLRVLPLPRACDGVLLVPVESTRALRGLRDLDHRIPSDIAQGRIHRDLVVRGMYGRSARFRWSASLRRYRLTLPRTEIPVCPLG